MKTCALLVLLGCTACHRPFDGIGVCFPVSDDRIVAEVSVSCASDHKGAKLSCEAHVQGTTVHIEAMGHDGRDTEDVCAPALTATCETAPLPDGDYTVLFEDETFEIAIPNTDDSSCASDT